MFNKEEVELIKKSVIHYENYEPDKNAVGLYLKANKSFLEIAELFSICYDLLSLIKTSSKVVNEKLKKHLDSFKEIVREIPKLIENIKDNVYGSFSDKKYLTKLIEDNRASILEFINFTQETTYLFIKEENSDQSKQVNMKI